MDKQPLQNKVRFLIAFLITIIILLLCICIFLLASKDEAPVLSPDIAPSNTDKYAEPFDGASGDKLEEPEGGGAASIACTKNVTIDLSSEKATMMFGNPSRSNQNIIVQVVIQDTVIAQSGLITPGSKITTLELLPSMKKSLSEGTYIGKYIVLFYDTETDEKELVSTEMFINIIVKE